MDSVLESIVRIGIVSDLDKSRKRARVIFRDLDMTSGWLYVLQHPTVVDISAAGEHYHNIKDTYTGGGMCDFDGKHSHNAGVEAWMPKINQSVLVLYLPVFNSDGFILGVIP